MRGKAARTMVRRVAMAFAMALAVSLCLTSVRANDDDPDMEGFISTLGPEAAKAGVSPGTFARAMTGLIRDPEVVALATAQPEHDLTVGGYVGRLVSQQRIETGRERLAGMTDTLRAIEDRYGVDRHVLIAIWGVETGYGASLGQRAVIRSLATLALVDARRSAFWRRELVAALLIVERGDATPEDMVGSWAGAVGHTQFMPSTFRAHAVDFDGDGRRDLWRTPPDALASAAAYLASSGWRRGELWGLEVALPPGFDVGQVGLPGRKPIAFWRDQGVAPAAGVSWPSALTEVRLLLPAGAAGPAFLVGAGFDAVLRYNPAVSYALAVSHLADRIGGGRSFAAAWPEGDRALAKSEREELQRLLVSAGLDPGPVDGVLGGLTRAALRSYQRKIGLPPDGHPNPGILERLRAELNSVPRVP